MNKRPICRCSQCFERFYSDELFSHYKDTREPMPQSKSNCWDTYQLMEKGWRQGPTGVWSFGK